MKITITPTPEIVAVDGVPCRRWEGLTEAGRPVEVFVHGIGTHDPEAQRELDAALSSVPVPAISLLGWALAKAEGIEP